MKKEIKPSVKVTKTKRQVEIATKVVIIDTNLKVSDFKIYLTDEAGEKLIDLHGKPVRITVELL